MLLGGWPYAAGLYEGEGNVGTYRVKARQQIVLRMKIRMCDLEPLERFATIVGTGRIYGPWMRTENRKPFYEWRSNDTREIARMMEHMTPYLSPRRIAQYEEQLAKRNVGWT